MVRVEEDLMDTPLYEEMASPLAAVVEDRGRPPYKFRDID